MSLTSTTDHLPVSSQTLRIAGVLRADSSTIGSHPQGVPMVVGLAVPRGQLNHARSGVLSGLSEDYPVQIEVLNRWSDGSARWILASVVVHEIPRERQEVEFVIPDHGCDEESLHNKVAAEFHTEPGSCAAVRWSGDEIRLETRTLHTEIPGMQTLRIQPRLLDQDGTDCRLRLVGIRTELTGPVRHVFVVNCRLESMPFVTIQLRLTLWSNKGLVQAETRIRNTRRARHSGGLWDLGDPGSVRFTALELIIRSDDLSDSASTCWQAERSSAWRQTRAKVSVRQFGSGGRFWCSRNHISDSGQVSVASRGYEVQTETGTLRGYRAEPTMVMEQDDRFLAIAYPEFWQQFPGSLTAMAGTAVVGLFPQLPSVLHELQGGEQKTQSVCVSMGLQKTGLGLEHRRGCAAGPLDWVYAAPRMTQSPLSVRDSMVFPWFTPADSETSGDTVRHNADHKRTVGSSAVAARLADYLHAATSGRFSLEARRASIDEYGWRNYGDIPADHEQTHYPGANTVVSHYNNQFDMILGGILQLASTGNSRWYDLFDPLARHVMDIDIYHTNADRAAFNGGMFWHTDHYLDAKTSTHRTYSRHNRRGGQPYGGGPGCEHNYTTGLLHYYFLTGNPEARESVLMLADWVIHMDDGRRTIFGLLDPGPTGAASATVSPDYHGPGRGSGNSVNALLDAWILSGSPQYIGKLEELIRRCVHPCQNPSDLHLADAETHWSYTIFLTALGRYLLMKRESGSLDAMYHYAREVMKTYGRWMALNERRTLDRPEELQYPTEAWAVQDLRKANVLRIAASCEDDTAQAASMRGRADLISDAAWSDLRAFGDDAQRARCLAIIMTEGPREVFHRDCVPDAIPECPIPPNPFSSGEWSMFISQKRRVTRLMKSPLRLLNAVVSAIQPRRLCETWDALRRMV